MTNDSPTVFPHWLQMIVDVLSLGNQSSLRNERIITLPQPSHVITLFTHDWHKSYWHKSQWYIASFPVNAQLHKSHWAPPEYGECGLMDRSDADVLESKCPFGQYPSYSEARMKTTSMLRIVKAELQTKGSGWEEPHALIPSTSNTIEKKWNNTSLELLNNSFSTMMTWFPILWQLYFLAWS